MTLPPSILHARELVAELIAQGVRHVVLSPGSRSAPLAYAAYCADRAGLLTVHVKIDERGAGFLALGLAKGGQGPAAVITTSGTAVANLHPAVLEAHHAQVPLLVLSADRPHELRGTGANQTTDQVDLFGPAARLSIDLPAPDVHTDTALTRAATARAVAAARGTASHHRGPVQINCGLREPLAPTAAELAELAGYFGALDGPVTAATLELPPFDFDTAAIEAIGTTVVIAGDGAGLEAAHCATRNGWPLIAEPSARVVGLAHGPLVLAHARPLTEQVTQVLVFGRPTLTRQVQRLMATADQLVIVADSAAPYVDPGRRATRVLPAVPQPWLTAPDRPRSNPWLQDWQQASDAAGTLIDAQVREFPDATAQRVALAVTDSLAALPTLFVGASSPIRDLDLYGRRPAGEGVLANRGLAGIDGTVSTALGIALGLGEPMRALMGDLTFLHDIGGLLREPGALGVDLDIIVLNDHGGAIFDGLEHGQTGDRVLFERVFTTPQHARLERLCAGYGVAHLACAPADLAGVLAETPVGLRVIEVPLDPRDRPVAARRLAGELTRVLGG